MIPVFFPLETRLISSCNCVCTVLASGFPTRSSSSPLAAQQMPSKILSLGRMEKLVFLSNKTRAAFRLGPKCPAYRLTKVKPCYKHNKPMDVGSCCWLSYWKISLMDKSLGGFRHLALVGYQACKIISCIKSNLSKLNCSFHD